MRPLRATPVPIVHDQLAVTLDEPPRRTRPTSRQARRAPPSRMTNVSSCTANPSAGTASLSVVQASFLAVHD